MDQLTLVSPCFGKQNASSKKAAELQMPTPEIALKVKLITRFEFVFVLVSIIMGLVLRVLHCRSTGEKEITGC